MGRRTGQRRRVGVGVGVSEAVLKRPADVRVLGPQLAEPVPLAVCDQAVAEFPGQA